MIYIDTTSTDPYFNFGLEYYLITEKKFDEPVFLFWQTEPTLMIGKFQNTLEEINLPYAKEHQVQIVRRLSGGGTIYTDRGGWQFSFIFPNQTGEIDFSHYISPVIDALHQMGIAGADFNGRNDLVIDGKKFSGNAQFLYHGVTLHHGSLLFDTDIEQMVKCTTVDTYKITSKGIKSVRERVTNISEHLPKPVSSASFQTQMVQHIMGGSTYKTYTLTEQDRIRVEALAEKHFRNPERIYGRNPKCSLTRSGHFTGGNLNVKLEIAHNLIQDCLIEGDFFCSLDVDALCHALLQVPYEKDAIAAAIAPFDIEHELYQISRKELLDCIVP
ncbi:MAG: lipoate--protein ligase [Lachnospiraceae bacterium]